MPNNRLKRIVKWPVRQLRGFLENAWSLVSGLKLEDVVPPWLAETVSWLRVQVPRAFGMGSPGEQMSASVVLALAAIFTSLFTGGVTLVFVSLFALTFIGGALRLWPAVDDRWPYGRAQT